MAKRNNWVGVIVIALVFGMMVFGCDDDPTGDGSGGGGSTDPALNGTWVQAFWDFQYSISGNTLTLTDYDGRLRTYTKTSSGGGTDPLNGTWTHTDDYVTEYKFNNGSYSWATYSLTYSLTNNGTYTTSGNTLWLGYPATQTMTQIATYSISGNTLTLRYNDDGHEIVKTLTKTSSGGGTDPLNGTWTYTDYYDSGNYDVTTYKFNNGNLVISIKEIGYHDNYEDSSTGTYTTSGINITMTITRSVGTSITFNNGRFVISYGDYTQTGTYTTSGNNIITDWVEGQYSINGNILTITSTDPETGEIETSTFIKK
jgi:hypothetical protein